MSNNSTPNQSKNTVVIIVAIAVATVVIVLLMLIAVLLIRNENQQTRDTMEKIGQETRDGMKDAAKEGGQEVVKAGADEARDTIKEIPSIILGDLRDIIKGGTGDKDDSQPGDLITGVLDIVREGVEVIEGTGQEMFAISSEKEIAIGKEYHAEMIKTHKVVNSRKDLDRIQKLAKPFLETRTRQDIPYTFTIIEDKQVNAFALPGGYIYFNTGMLEFVANDAELQSVIGHEIGHVDLKHCVEGFTFAVTSGELTGGAASVPVDVLYNFYHLQFSEDDEFEADKYAYIRMRKLGHSKEAALSAQRHMIEYHKSLGVETSEKDAESIPEVLQNEFHNHFRTHPPSEERLKELEAIQIEGVED